MEHTQPHSEQPSLTTPETPTMAEYLRSSLEVQHRMVSALRSYALGHTDIIDSALFSGPVKIALESAAPEKVRATLKLWADYFEQNLDDIDLFFKLSEVDAFDRGTESKVLSIGEEVLLTAERAIVTLAS